MAWTRALATLPIFYITKDGSEALEGLARFIARWLLLPTVSLQSVQLFIVDSPGVHVISHLGFHTVEVGTSPLMQPAAGNPQFSAACVTSEKPSLQPQHHRRRSSQMATMPTLELEGAIRQAIDANQGDIRKLNDAVGTKACASGGCRDVTPQMICRD